MLIRDDCGSAISAAANDLALLRFMPISQYRIDEANEVFDANSSGL
jgi:hypothetical protein